MIVRSRCAITIGQFRSIIGLGCTITPDFADAFYNVAKAYVDMKQYEADLEWARRVVDVAQRALPADHMYRIVYQEFLADLERVKQ